MDYFSPSVSTLVLEKMRGGSSNLPVRFKNEAEDILDKCIQAIQACRPDGMPQTSSKQTGSKIAPPAEPFLEQDLELRSFLSRYLDSDVEIQPRDVVLRLCFYWSGFTEALEYLRDPGRTEFFTIFTPYSSGGDR
jgi:DNA excision repair protein ERCC-2